VLVTTRVWRSPSWGIAPVPKIRRDVTAFASRQPGHRERRRAAAVPPTPDERGEEVQVGASIGEPRDRLVEGARRTRVGRPFAGGGAGLPGRWVHGHGAGQARVPEQAVFVGVLRRISGRREAVPAVICTGRLSVNRIVNCPLMVGMARDLGLERVGLT
jgi:hypothetical protein